jgi:hypothetical protein
MQRVRFISSRKGLPIRFTLALHQEQILRQPRSCADPKCGIEVTAVGETKTKRALEFFSADYRWEASRPNRDFWLVLLGISIRSKGLLR